MFYENFIKACNNKGEKPTPILKKLNISSGSLTNWKNGAIPDTEKLIKLSSYLNVSIDYLVGCTNIEKQFSDNNIDKELIDIIVQLTPQESARLKDFAGGMIANRK